MLGLLALHGAAEAPTLIGFEEPENGIHPQRIELVADLLGTLSTTSQLIVTTHSPFLLDHVARESLLLVRRSGQGTTIHPLLRTGLPLLDARHAEDSVRDGLKDDEAPVPLSAALLRGDLDD